MSEVAIARGAGAAAAARLPAGWARVLRRAAREPFAHFLLLGAVLFGVNEYLEARSKFTHITITPDVVSGIVENYRLQYGLAPTPRQLAALVESFIREEVFYHEALRLGLDRDDEIIRRRLVQKYEFVQQDLDLAHAPTDEELRAFFDANPQRYQLPGKVSFSHVYFSPDARGEDGARADGARLAVALSARGVTRAPEEGDRFPGPTDYAAASEEEVGRVFGREGLAAEVFGLEPNRWSGPIRSGLGWHLVYVSARQPAAEQSFDVARDAVRRDYMEAARGRRNEQTYEKLRKSYVIARE
jgi:hypothetical protein